MNNNESWGQAAKAVLGPLWRLIAGLFNKPAIPKERGFGTMSNIVTGVIMEIILFVIAVGTMIALMGQSQESLIIGLLIAGLAAALLVTGYTDHPADPPTWGIITIRDKPWLIDGKSIAVKGIVFLCNWPFIWISSIKIQATWEEMVFPMKVLSKDGVQMIVEIRITARPDRDELHIFLNNGKDHADRWGYIKTEIKGIAENVTKNHTRDQDYIDIMQNAQELSRLIQTKIYETRADGKQKLCRGLFGERTFGIEIRRVQLNSSLPDNIATSMSEKAARQIEYDADVVAVEKVIAAAKKDGTVLTFEQALDKVNTMRRIRDGKDSRIDFVASGQGNVTGVVLQGTNLNVGGASSGSKK